MTAPITGPFTKTQDFAGPPGQGLWMTKFQRWFRQHKPYTEMLAYDMTYRRVLSRFSLVGGASSYSDAPGGNTPDVVEASNKAYAKFVGNLGEAQQWANNLAEMRKTEAMIVTRANTLFKFAVLLARRRFVEAAQTLGTFVPRKVYLEPPKGRFFPPASKEFGKLWLEFHFGWEPLVKDISAGLETLVDPFGSFHKIRGSARVLSSSTTTGGGGTSTWKRFDRFDTKYRMSAVVKVLNTNETLLQQLGFTNALSIAWEAVPFSFVVDWFGNVGQVLASYTDFHGTTLLHPVRSVMQIGSRSEVWTDITPSSPTYRAAIIRIQSESGWYSRVGDIQGPTLKLKPFRGFSPVRGATAVALLTQFLKDRK